MILLENITPVVACSEGKSREEYGNRPVQSLLFETYFISEIEDENGKETEQVQ